MKCRNTLICSVPKLWPLLLWAWCNEKKMWYDFLIRNKLGDREFVDCCFGCFCAEECLFSNIFIQMSELYISEAFCEYQACQIPSLYQTAANICWKHVLSCARMEGQGAKEIVCSANKIFVFHIFSLCCRGHDLAWPHLPSM
jgi:hypothetical protein